MKIVAAVLLTSVFVCAQAPAPPPPPLTRITLMDGKVLEGTTLGRGLKDLQLRTSDNRIHLLRATGSGDRYREVTSQSDWPQYNGDPGGNRYTNLPQITPKNVDHLAAQ